MTSSARLAVLDYDAGNVRSAMGGFRAVGADAFVTGEGKGKLYHEAREAGVTVFLAGHYATETFGVRALQSLADEWGVTTTFSGPAGIPFPFRSIEIASRSSGIPLEGV